MSFGVYVHIPYCLQRCSYCDFATYEKSQILPPSQYVELLKKEIRYRRHFFQPTQLDTIYFGGGTPSLLEPSLILAVIEELEKNGFSRGPETEITLEINPATLTDAKLQELIVGGFNRFSVGAQSFDDRLLKMVRREHNAQQTLETLELLRKNKLNFNFDLLFALPTQTFSGFSHDVEIALSSGASHISPYCLTVPNQHPLSKNRPLEEEQVKMFELLTERLESSGYLQYEISNFAKPGFESRHNSLYWNDDSYWGIGLSSHSYSHETSWGTRFWNPSGIQDYEKQIQNLSSPTSGRIHESLPPEQSEVLEVHQALTDFCHISLRLNRGLDQRHFQKKFPPSIWLLVEKRLNGLIEKGWVQHTSSFWKLTPQGRVLSNQVFFDLTFLPEDLPSHC